MLFIDIVFTHEIYGLKNCVINYNCTMHDLVSFIFLLSAMLSQKGHSECRPTPNFNFEFKATKIVCGEFDKFFLDLQKVQEIIRLFLQLFGMLATYSINAILPNGKS